MEAAAASEWELPGTGGDGLERPLLRSDLKVRHQVLGGEECYILKNPDTGKYFRFRPTEYDVLRLLDGQSTFEDIARRFGEIRPGQLLSVAAIEKFVRSLRSKDLVERTPEEKRIALYERLRKHHARRRSSFRNLMFLKKKLMDPNELFGRIHDAVPFFWTPTFVKLSIVLIAAAAALAIAEWPTFSRSYMAFFVSIYDPELFLANYILLQITFGWMALIHESSHGMTCRHFGGEVHEVGVILLYLQSPGAYCNVNDAWSFPKRSQRLWVTLAGGYSETILSALAVFLWWLAPPGGFWERQAFAILTMGFVSNVLSDYNPLVRFDGYYMLADYLEVPNLLTNSWKYLGYLFRRHVLRLPVEFPPASPRTRRIYGIYGSLSFLYILSMMTFFLLFLAKLILDTFQEAGWLLVALPASVMLARPARAVTATLRFFVTDKKDFLRSPGGIAISSAVAVAVVLLAFLPRLPLWIHGNGVVEPPARVPLRAGAPGRVVNVQAEAGERLEKGDAVVQLESPLLDAEVLLAEAAADQAAAELAAAEAVGDPQSAELLRSRMRAGRAAVDRLRLHREALRVRAPSAGQLVAPDLTAAVGRVVRVGEALGEILEPGPPRVRIRVPERQVGEIQPGEPAELKVAAWPGHAFRGRVLAVLPSRAPDNPAEAAAAEAEPTLVPTPYYHVLAEFDDPEGRLLPGMEARVRVLTGRLSPAGFVVRWARRFAGERAWFF